MCRLQICLRPAPWFVFQTALKPTCSNPSKKAYVAKCKNLLRHTLVDWETACEASLIPRFTEHCFGGDVRFHVKELSTALIHLIFTSRAGQAGSRSLKMEKLEAKERHHLQKVRKGTNQCEAQTDFRCLQQISELCLVEFLVLVTYIAKRCEVDAQDIAPEAWIKGIRY